MFGYELVEMLGKNLTSLMPERFRQIHLTSVSIFILRPLSAAIFALCLLLVLWPGVKKRLGRGGAEVT
jgi:hypothetical protein